LIRLFEKFRGVLGGIRRERIEILLAQAGDPRKSSDDDLKCTDLSIRITDLVLVNCESLRAYFVCEFIQLKRRKNKFIIVFELFFNIRK